MVVKQWITGALLALIAGLGGVEAETALSGQFSLAEVVYLSGTNGSIYDDTEGAAGIVHSGELGARLSSWGEIYSLEAELQAAYSGDGDPEISLPRAVLDLTPSSWLTLRLGLFTYTPGNAEFRSPLSYLSQRDTEALLSGDLSSVRSASELLQATAFVGPAYLRLTAMPLRPRPKLPETDSIWFPRETIPEFVVRGPDDTVYLLRSLYYPAEAEAADRVVDGSLLGEVSATLGPVDGTLLGYSGYSPQLLLQPKVDVQSVSSTFDVALAPIQNRITALGAAVATSLGATRIYAEATHTWNRKTVMNLEDWQKISSIFTQNDPAPLYTSNVQEILAGGSYQGYLDLSAVGGLQWVVLGEYFTTFGVPADADPGILSEFVGLSGTINTYRPELSLGVYSVTSWKAPGFGVASVFSLAWQATPAVALNLRYPMFLGDAGNELGQYGDLHVVHAGVTVRF